MSLLESSFQMLFLVDAVGQNLNRTGVRSQNSESEAIHVGQSFSSTRSFSLNMTLLSLSLLKEKRSELLILKNALL